MTENWVRKMVKVGKRGLWEDTSASPLKNVYRMKLVLSIALLHCEREREREINPTLCNFGVCKPYLHTQSCTLGLFHAYLFV